MVRLAWADRLRNEIFSSDVCAFTWGSMWCVYFLIIMFGHASTSGSIYKTDSLFSAPGRRGWVVGIHVPCDGIMAVERCVGYFVTLACSRTCGRSSRQEPP